MTQEKRSGEGGGLGRMKKSSMDQSPISRGPAIFYVIYFTCDYFGIGRVSSRDCQQRLQDESSVIAAPARTLSILSPTEEFLIMWTTLALLSALSVTPGQNDLSLTHVRPTLGLLGPTRSTKTISPGDILYLSFDIEGISVDEQGMVRYSTALEVSDASGKMLFKRAPEKSEAKMSLGGNRVAAYAQFSVGLDTPPGEYGCKITVKDLVSGKEKSLMRSAKVVAKDFALVRTAVSVDLDGAYPVVVFGCGQGLWVRSNAVGFARRRRQATPCHVHASSAG